MSWITLDLAKQFLRVDANDEDDLITILIDAAQSQIEAITGLCLDLREVNVIVDDWSELNHITVGPIASISEIDYIDPAGVVHILPASQYRLAKRSLQAGIYPATGTTLPQTIGEASVSVTLQCGYVTIPGVVRQALLLALGDAYSFRENTVADRSVTPTELPNGILSLLANFRVY